MATPNKPFNPPFAQNGDREQVGATSDDNSVNYNEGYTLPYEKPPQDGGKDIERKKLNQILYDFTSKVNDLSQEIDKWINLTTENLNNVKDRGNYFQNLTQQATTANNYPINQAGYLLVFNNGINSWGVTQIYKIYNSDKFYIRRTTSATTWSAWDSLVLTSEMIPTINNAVSNKEDKTKLTFAPINSANNLDANNLTSGGMYWITTKSGSNLPTTNGAFLEVVSNNEQVRQNFYPDVIRNEAMYFRTRDAGGTWSNWNSVLTADYTESLINNKASLANLQKRTGVVGNTFFNTAVTFSSAFSTTCLFVICWYYGYDGSKDGAGESSGMYVVTNPTKSGFTAVRTSAIMNYLAIGY